MQYCSLIDLYLTHFVLLYIITSLLCKISGKVGYSDVSAGSWILQSLYEEVADMSGREEIDFSLFALLNKVNCNIAKRKTRNNQKIYLKSAGSFTHQMTKDLTLRITENVNNGT